MHYHNIYLLLKIFTFYYIKYIIYLTTYQTKFLKKNWTLIKVDKLIVNMKEILKVHDRSVCVLHTVQARCGRVPGRDVLKKVIL